MAFCGDEGYEAAHRRPGYCCGRILGDDVLTSNVWHEFRHQPIDVPRTTPTRAVFRGTLRCASCGDEQRAGNDPSTQQRIEDLVHPPVHAEVGRRRVDHVLDVVHDKDPLNRGGRIRLWWAPHPHFTRQQPLRLLHPEAFKLPCDLPHDTAGSVGVAPREHSVLHMHQPLDLQVGVGTFLAYVVQGLVRPRAQGELVLQGLRRQGSGPLPPIVAHVGQGQPAWLPRPPSFGASRHTEGRIRRQTWGHHGERQPGFRRFGVGFCAGHSQQGTPQEDKSSHGANLRLAGLRKPG